MIFSENRFTLFRIMLERAMPLYDPARRRVNPLVSPLTF